MRWIRWIRADHYYMICLVYLATQPFHDGTKAWHRSLRRNPVWPSYIPNFCRSERSICCLLHPSGVPRKARTGPKDGDIDYTRLGRPMKVGQAGDAADR